METTLVYDTIRGPMINSQGSGLLVGSFSLTIQYQLPPWVIRVLVVPYLNKNPLKAVTVRGNDPSYCCFSGLGE